jgi:OmpA-OmpF porin, OOP family
LLTTKTVKNMSFNILDAVKGHFSSDLIGKAASFLGESEGGVSKAVGGILPTVLSGLASKAASSDGANEVAKMAGDAHNSGFLGNIGGFFSDGGGLLAKGAGLLSSLFGNKVGGIVDAISGFAGIKGSSVNSLLSLAAPVALGSLGKHAADNNLGASGIGSLLSSSSSSWSSLLPSGLGSLVGGLGLGGVTNAFSSASGKVEDAAGKVGGYATGAAEEVAERSGGALKWLLPLLLLGGLGAGAWYWFNNKSKAPEGTDKVVTGDTTNKGGAAVAVPKITIDSVTGVVNYDLGALSDLELPGGAKLTGVAKDGFENTLVGFIKTGTIDTVNKKANWFTLHDVQFVSGKTTYATDKALAQIKNVGAILKAYPNVTLKLGGYTDISGIAANNKALSQSRADQVKKDLLANGATANQIAEAVGYGSEFAEAKDGDKEGMARDRKTSAKVASK